MLSNDEIQKDRLVRISPYFDMDNHLLFYQKKICVLCKNVTDIPKPAHDCKAAGYFLSAKTLARLNHVYWKRKTKYVEEYCLGFLKCQQMKDGRTKPLGVPQPLLLPSQRLGSIPMNFVAHVPLSSKGFDNITTFVDLMTKRVHMVAYRANDSAKKVPTALFNTVFWLHDLPHDLVLERDPKFTSRFWR